VPEQSTIGTSADYADFEMTVAFAQRAALRCSQPGDAFWQQLPRAGDHHAARQRASI
jgi:hypothetical protein